LKAGIPKKVPDSNGGVCLRQKSYVDCKEANDKRVPAWLFFAIGILLLLALPMISIGINADLIGESTNVTSRVNVTNAPPFIISVNIDDPIDLIPNSTAMVYCNATVKDYNGWADIISVNATFFDAVLSTHESADHPRTHYTNSSCVSDEVIDAYTIIYLCGFNVEYYANAGDWNCTVRVTDTYGISDSGQNSTTISELIAIITPEMIDYGDIPVLDTSNNVIANVTNVGNRDINLTLYGYNNTPSDGLAMGCEQGNISYVNQRWSLTDQAWNVMTVLDNTAPQVVPSLTIMQRNNTREETINQTNWKLYVEQGPGGTPFGICTGQVVFGAILAS
jgi:hypothetical protein